MSVDEKWQVFGSTMGDIIEYIVIYFIVLGGVVLVTIVVAVLYALRKAKQKANGIDPKTNKANTSITCETSCFVLSQAEPVDIQIPLRSSICIRPSPERFFIEILMLPGNLLVG